MSTIQLESVVGEDGYLTLRVKLGEREANLPVRVTIEALSTQADHENGAKMPWHELIGATYGSCAGLGLEGKAE